MFHFGKRLGITTFFLCFILIFELNGQCSYEMIWEDNFDGSSLNSENWSYQLGAGGWGNQELQTYTNTNAIVQNGKLQIIADEANPEEYTSSRIRSINLRDVKFGKLEASIKLPQGQGIWPAFWMMPTCSIYGTWPSSGEIDIMEYLGHQTNKSYATCHFGNSPSDKGQLGDVYTLPSGEFTDDFHLFSVEWSENNIKWFVDDLLVHEISSPDVGSYIYPFNEEFHFILNVAVGGAWPGNPNESTSFPQIMEVDYVRAYQLVEDWTIEGNDTEIPNSTGIIYTVPDLPGTSYDWYIPSCATLISGQGTSQITVDWQTEGGDIDVVIGLDCQTIFLSKSVELSINLLPNGNFEKGKKNWFSSFYNGGSGHFNLINIAPFQGVHHICIEVLSLGANFWDVQFRHQEFEVNNGDSYTLSFYGKADDDNSHMRVDFRNSDGNISTDNVHFYLTDQWTFYQYEYIATEDIDELVLDFNHGYETGIYCYDAVQFELAGPAISTCPSQNCVDDLILKNTLIQDALYSATNNINSTSIIQFDQTIDLKAGHEISLEAGFETDASSNFSAEIGPCDVN